MSEAGQPGEVFIVDDDPAVRETVAHDLIDTVKGSGLVFAYYPDPKWLASSQFLGNCDGNPGATGVTPVVTTG